MTSKPDVIAKEKIKTVEDAIKNSGSYPKITELWYSLNKQMSMNELLRILIHLHDDKKIIFDKDGSIIWIFADDPESRKLLETSTKL